MNCCASFSPVPWPAIWRKAAASSAKPVRTNFCGSSNTSGTWARAPRHRALESDMIIELAHTLRLDADARPRAIIGVVAKGHDRVEPVVAAGEFDDHQDASFLGRRSRVGLGPERRAAKIAGSPK